MLSRSAGLSSPKGQDGLNYWLCCNYSALRLVIRLPALPQPSWPFHPHGGEWGGSPLPATGALRKASKGGALPWALGPLLCSQQWSGGCWDPFLWQVALLGLSSLPSPRPFF